MTRNRQGSKFDGGNAPVLKKYISKSIPPKQPVVVEIIIAMGICESGVVVENQTDCLIA